MSSFYLMKTNNTNELWKTIDGVHVLTKNIETIISDDKNNTYKIIIKKGFKCDGLSVPKLFQWFLPSWDNKNSDFNLAGIIHDALYGKKGFGIFNREDSDSLFRGLLRDAGLNRFHASTADFMLGLFAKNHWRR